MTQKEFFTIGEISETITGGNERAARKLINTAGGALDEYKIDPGETITRELLIDLAAIRAGDRVGRKAAELLR